MPSPCYYHLHRSHYRIADNDYNDDDDNDHDDDADNDADADDYAYINDEDKDYDDVSGNENDEDDNNKGWAPVFLISAMGYYKNHAK